jgi:hypothetical protein
VVSVTFMARSRRKLPQVILSRPIPLHAHGAIKFSVAIVLAFGALVLGLPFALAAALVVVAALLAGLALDAVDNHDGGVVRLRDHAQIDLTLGIVLIAAGIIASCRGSLAAGLVVFASGAALIWLRLRTRYTSRTR